jgi:peptidyl-prolyl cis-trans isomerase C
MRARHLLRLAGVTAAVAAAGVTVAPRWLFAGVSPAEQAHRDAVAVHIGSTTVSVGELEDRIAAVPHFQLRAFGDSADAIRRKFFDQIILPEVLYSLAAEKAHLRDQLPTANKVQRILGTADTRMVTQGLRASSSIGMDEVRAYFEVNRSKYDTPQRIYIYRILCATRKAAEEVLDLAKREKTLETFSRLAHDLSIDKATNMRGGNLGAVSPDGTSSEAGLVVDPAVVKAASTVKDGDIVPEPVVEKTGPDSTGFAVVWRRGTVPANHRTPEDAAAQIRESIWKEEAERATRKHLEELRAAHVTELNESLLNGIDITSVEGDVVTRRRPGEVPPLGHGHAIPTQPKN